MAAADADAQFDACIASFQTNVIDLCPGAVMSILDHPQRALGDGKRLLVLESRIDGRANDDINHYCEVRSADQPAPQGRAPNSYQSEEHSQNGPHDRPPKPHGQRIRTAPTSTFRRVRSNCSPDGTARHAAGCE